MLACIWLLSSLGQTALYVWRINLLVGLCGGPVTPDAVARAIRFTTLDAICTALDCQPGDILEHVAQTPPHD